MTRRQIYTPGGGTGDEGADVTWDESLFLDDSMSQRLSLHDSVVLRDSHSIQHNRTDLLRLTDQRISIISSALKQSNDLIGLDDSARFSLNDWRVDRAVSEVANADAFGDISVSQASPDGTGGTGSSLTIDNGIAVGNNDLEAFIKIDMRRFVGYLGHSSITPFSLKLRVRTTALSAVALQWNLRRQVADPFTESTATWNTRPTGGTSVATGSVTATTGSGGDVFILLTKAQLDQILVSPQWIYVRLFTTATNGLTQIIVTSRNNAAFTPALTLNLEQV